MFYKMCIWKDVLVFYTINSLTKEFQKLLQILVKLTLLNIGRQ